MTPTDRTLLDRWRQQADAEAFAELVARHGRMVVAVCRRIVRDPQLADDVAQESFLRLARIDCTPPTNLAGWLHRVATHCAVDARRGMRTVPSPTADLEPPASATPHLEEWRELEHLVDAAIAELPEALRAVVVGHFLEGRSHRELARELRIGFRTVGYRIAKGIERLRSTLEDRGLHIGPDALAAALVALPRPETVSTAWTASLGKFALTGPKALGTAAAVAAVATVGSGSAKSFVVGAVAVITALLGSLWLTFDVRHEPVDTPESSVSAGRVGRRTVVETGQPAAVARTEVPSSESTPSEIEVTNPDEVTLSGRCIDVAGRPVAGASVDLEGRSGGSQAMRQYLLTHEAPQWTDPDAVRTATDGRFQFRFVPPPPYHFEITATLPDGVPMSIRLGSLEPGTRHDLGEAQLSTGFQLGGTVQDLDHQPVSDLGLWLWREGEGRYDEDGREIEGPISRWQPPQNVRGRSDPLGNLVFSEPALAGARYSVRVDGRTVHEPSGPFPLLESRPDLAVTVGAASSPADPGTRLRIAGKVATITGEVPQGVRIHADRPDGRAGTRTSTDRRGAFEILRHPDRVGEAEALLRATCPGYVDWTSSAPILWGTEDLDIVLHPGPSLELQVVRDRDGAPVERFGLTAWRLPGTKSVNRQPGRELVLEDRPGGIEHFESFTPGKWWIDVHFPESPDRGFSVPRTIEVVEGRPAHVEFRVRRFAEFECLVLHADGAPAVDLPVELLRPTPNEPARLEQVATGRAAVPVNIPGAVIELVDTGTTDDAGRCTLTGPAGIDCAIRLPGPGNLPTIRQPVRCDAGVPLELVLPPAGRIRGRLTPRDVLDSLRDESAADADRPPGIRLVDPENAYDTVPTDRYAKHGLPISDGGSFAIEGVPAGTWDVELCWPRVQDGRRSWVKSTISRALAVRPGMCEDVVLDLEPLRRHPLHIRVLRNGEPWPVLVQFLRGKHHEPRRPTRAEDQHLFRCDVHGELDCRLPAGSWLPQALIVCHDGQHGSVSLPAFEVGPDSPPERILAFEVGSRRVRVLAPDGTPVPKLVFPGFAMVQTDDAGRAIVRGAPGTHPVELIRKPFGDMGRWFRWRNERDPSEHLKAWVAAGEITLLATDGPEQVIRLPAEWAELPD